MKSTVTIFFTLLTIFLNLWLPVKVVGEEFYLKEFELSFITKNNPSSDWSFNPLFVFDRFLIGVIISMCGQLSLFSSLFIFNFKAKSMVLKITIILLWISLLMMTLAGEYLIFSTPFILSSIILFFQAKYINDDKN